MRVELSSKTKIGILMLKIKDYTKQLNELKKSKNKYDKTLYRKKYQYLCNNINACKKLISRLSECD